jgi:hypothetical protein
MDGRAKRNASIVAHNFHKAMIILPGDGVLLYLSLSRGTLMLWMSDLNSKIVYLRIKLSRTKNKIVLFLV